jgi:hypothetical protein
MRGIWREGNFIGDHEGSGNGRLYPYGPCFREEGGHSFPRAFDRRVKFLFIRRNIMRKSRDL